MTIKWNVQHKTRKTAAKQREAEKYVDGLGWTRVAQSPYKTRRAAKERRAREIAKAA